jgi:RNA polymerase sigma-70 factor (ECF subfamily)
LDGQSTSWTLINEAIGPDTEVRYRAQAKLIRRYDRVVRRYLAGAFRCDIDDPKVEECAQECWKRLVEGRFQAVSPEKGRFRDYLRTVLSNLVNSRRRKDERAPAPLGDLDPPAPDPVSDAEYRDLFRTALLERAMEQLLRQDQQKDQGFFTVLQARRDHPEASMAELAGRLSAGGQERNENWVRVTLFRARQRLCELLRLEVALELDDRTTAAVDEELADLELLVYCQPTS